MRHTTTVVNRDICGSEDAGVAEWDRHPLSIQMGENHGWGKLAREMDLCGQCWLEILRVMHARCKP